MQERRWPPCQEQVVGMHIWSTSVAKAGSLDESRRDG